MISLLIPVARGLFAAYAVIALAAFFPLQIQDPNWQLRLISNLVNNAPLPLAGMGLLLLAQGPEAPASAQAPNFRKQVVRLRWLAVGAALGFALLALLQLRVSLQGLQQSDALHLNQNQQLQQQFVAIRTTLSSSTDPQQLSRAASVLLPPAERGSITSLPIHRQRALLLEQLTKNDVKARRELDRQRSQRLAGLVVDGLRNLSLCLVFALSFLAIKPRISFLAWLRASPRDS